jgi:hypothetical protein
MFKHLRIAILALMAVVTPIPHSLAEDIGGQPHISTGLVVLPLIRVADAQCHRDCDATFEACVAQARMINDRGASDARVLDYIQTCRNQHAACYRAC